MFPQLGLARGIFFACFFVSLYYEQPEFVGEWAGACMCGFVVVLLVEVGLLIMWALRRAFAMMEISRILSCSL